MTDGEKLDIALNLDKRSKTELAKKMKVSRVALDKWTKREYFTPKILAKLKLANIDINKNGEKMSGDQVKEQDVRIGFKRFVKITYPDNITEKEIDILVDTFKLWKVK